MRSWEVRFCLLPGVVMKLFNGSAILVSIDNVDTPPMIVDVETGEVGWVLLFHGDGSPTRCADRGHVGNWPYKYLNRKEPNPA